SLSSSIDPALGAGSSTRTPDSATDSSPGFHEMFTWSPPVLEETAPGTPFGAGPPCPGRRHQTIPARGEVVINNKMGALVGCAVLAFGLAACGSSSSSSSSGGAAA